MAMGTGVGEPT